MPNFEKSFDNFNTEKQPTATLVSLHHKIIGAVSIESSKFGAVWKDYIKLYSVRPIVRHE